MEEVKDTKRANVRISFDGRVYKIFRATQARERFLNEKQVLEYLEEKGCPFVPRVLDSNEETLELVISHAGQRVEQLSDKKLNSLFDELESYGVRHEDVNIRNVTYQSREGRFCIIDFEYANILDDPNQKSPEKFPDKKDLKAAVKFRQTASIKWSGMSHVGTVRKSNEDAFLAVSFNQHGFQYLGKFGQAELKHDGHVFAVSDGMGGANAGEYASKVAVAKINEYLPKTMPSGDTTALFKNSFERMFSEIFEAIHQALIYMGQCYEECKGMGSTLSLCWFTQGWLYFAHIGDTKIYHLPAKGGIKQISEDHTLVGSLLRSGKITEYEARTHPRRNILQRSLGANTQIINFQSGFLEHESGDMFLICSDGVNAGLWNRRLHTLLREPDENEIKLLPAERVVQTAVEKSGKDNTTAVVIEIL